MRHIEFLDSDHFESNYYRVPPPAGLSAFIDFFWETKFEQLWKSHPGGFSDAQFPNIGYTNIINLGTPFVMQVDDKKFSMKTDGFLPRYHAIECFHKPGNHLFGIKFRISPVIFEKKINFSEYLGYMFPLSYLLEQKLIEQVKKCKSFDERVYIFSNYFLTQIEKYKDSMQQVNIVSRILKYSSEKNIFSLMVEKEAAKNNISVRTLQRYFETCTGINTRQAIQVMRIRKAVTHIIKSPTDFDYTLYGYYDRSHFHKSLKGFLQKNTLKNNTLHLSILALLHK